MLYSKSTNVLPDATAILPTYSRPLSDNEQSYYLQSRLNGANDSILETEFRAPAALVTYIRVSLVWAILRVQHPLLASGLRWRPEIIRAAALYTPPSCPRTALLQAESCVEHQWRSPDDGAVSAGSRKLGDRKIASNTLSYIVLQSFAQDIRPTREYRLFFHFAHCCMDGSSAHMLINAFFVLLDGSSAPGQPPRTDNELEELLKSEWTKRWSPSATVTENVIPMCAEERLPQLTGRWRMLASRIEHSARQKRDIGGHTLPRRPSSTTENITRMIIYSPEDTRIILTRCRAAHVTISNALFTLCSMAWIRVARNQPQYNPKLPVLIYSAVSLRHLFTGASSDGIWQSSSHSLQPPYKQSESWLFLAVSYFNAVLPGFIPSSASTSTREAAVMWHRARSVREQFARYSRSPMFIPRVHSTTAERGERARRFAKEDDEALLQARGVGSAPASLPSPPPVLPSPSITTIPSQQPTAPSIALLGLSQLGNLDQFYDTRLYPSLDVFYIQGHTRKNKGGLMMFSHTFRGRLALQLGCDEAGFQPGAVEAFWAQLDQCIREYMIDALEISGAVKVKL